MTQGQNTKIGGYKLSSKQAQWYWRYNYVHKTLQWVKWNQEITTTYRKVFWWYQNLHFQATKTCYFNEKIK
jgi:hypothetical protein